MYYKRKLYNEIQTVINHKNAIIITGGRQVGKTSLMRQFYEKIPSDEKAWFDFDNPIDYKFFEEEDYENIFLKLENIGLSEKKRKKVFIDEIQNYPEITKIIKYLIDHHQVKFIVSGSASFYLQNLFPESLSGRKFLFKLQPLDFDEFLFFKKKIKSLPSRSKPNTSKKSLFEYEKLQQYYEEFKKWGGYPEVVLTEDKKLKEMTLKNIFTSYFEKDIIKFGDFKEIGNIRDLILLLASRVGSKIDISKISSELGTSRNTIYSQIGFLESTYFIHLLPRFSKSIDKIKSGSKKIYFADTGMLNQIAQIQPGNVLENCIFNQLKIYGELSYYERDKKEIDFILNKTTAFEVKTNATSKHVKKLKFLAEDLKLKNTYVISEKFTKGVDDIVYPQFL